MENTRPNLNLITIPIFISAIFYFILGAALVILILLMDKNNMGHWWAQFIGLGLMALTSFAIGVFVLICNKKLKERKKWALTACMVIGFMYVASIFIFLGIPILMGVFKKEITDWINQPASITL